MGGCGAVLLIIECLHKNCVAVCICVCECVCGEFLCVHRGPYCLCVGGGQQSTGVVFLHCSPPLLLKKKLMVSYVLECVFTKCVSLLSPLPGLMDDCEPPCEPAGATSTHSG